VAPPSVPGHGTADRSDGPVLGVLGDLVEDVVVWQLAPLAAGSDTPSRIVRTRGGSAANLAAHAAALVTTRFLGCVGADETGPALVASLRADGVDVRVTTGSRTGVIVILVDAAGERTMFPDRGANTEMAAVPPDWLAGLACLHVTAYSLTDDPTASTAEAALRQARADGALTSLDASSVSVLERLGPDAFRAWVERVDPDIVFANAEEAALLGWDVDAPAPRLVVVKHGSDPLRLRTTAGSSTWSVPPLTGVVDTTGAGDAFAAGFLAGVLRACWPLGPDTAAAIRATPPRDEALAAWCRLGHEQAAVVVRSPGAGRRL